MTRQPVKSLYLVAVDFKPRFIDWSKGYPEKWDYWEADSCSECGKIVTGARGEEMHRYVDDTDCDGYLYCDGPMMNFFYPLIEQPYEFDPEEAARKIADLPLCIVYPKWIKLCYSMLGYVFFPYNNR